MIHCDWFDSHLLIAFIALPIAFASTLESLLCNMESFDESVQKFENSVNEKLDKMSWNHHAELDELVRLKQSYSRLLKRAPAHHNSMKNSKKYKLSGANISFSELWVFPCQRKCTAQVAWYTCESFYQTRSCYLKNNWGNFFNCEFDLKFGKKTDIAFHVTDLTNLTLMYACGIYLHIKETSPFILTWVGWQCPMKIWAHLNPSYRSTIVMKMNSTSIIGTSASEHLVKRYYPEPFHCEVGCKNMFLSVPYPWINTKYS